MKDTWLQPLPRARQRKVPAVKARTARRVWLASLLLHGLVLGVMFGYRPSGLVVPPRPLDGITVEIVSVETLDGPAVDVPPAPDATIDTRPDEQNPPSAPVLARPGDAIAVRRRARAGGEVEDELPELTAARPAPAPPAAAAPTPEPAQDANAPAQAQPTIAEPAEASTVAAPEVARADTARIAPNAVAPLPAVSSQPERPTQSAAASQPATPSQPAPATSPAMASLPAVASQPDRPPPAATPQSALASQPQNRQAPSLAASDPAAAQHPRDPAQSAAPPTALAARQGPPAAAQAPAGPGLEVASRPSDAPAASAAEIVRVQRTPPSGSAAARRLPDAAASRSGVEIAPTASGTIALAPPALTTGAEIEPSDTPVPPASNAALSDAVAPDTAAPAAPTRVQTTVAQAPSNIVSSASTAPRAATGGSTAVAQAPTHAPSPQNAPPPANASAPLRVAQAPAASRPAVITRPRAEPAVTRDDAPTAAQPGRAPVRLDDAPRDTVPPQIAAVATHQDPSVPSAPAPSTTAPSVTAPSSDRPVAVAAAARAMPDRPGPARPQTAARATAQPIPVDRADNGEAEAPASLAFGEAAQTSALLRADAQSVDLGVAVEETLLAQPCAFVGTQTVGVDGAVVLTGFAPQNRAGRDIAREVSDVVGVTSVDSSDVTSVPIPCALTAFLGDLDRHRGEGVLSAPDRSTPKIHNFAFYDPLRIGLRSPKFESYIIVDYYAADGRVYHLDHDNWPGSAFPAERYVEFGGRDGIGVDVTLTPPGGREYMLVTASDTPLWPHDRPIASTPDAYVARLAARVEFILDRGGQIEVLGTIIETGEGEDD